MTKERFAELVGVEVGVVRGMLDRPAKKIGRHRFVNVAALTRRCQEKDSEPGCEVRDHDQTEAIQDRYEAVSERLRKSD